MLTHANGLSPWRKKLTCWCICKMYFSTKGIKSSSRFCILLSNQCVYETTVVNLATTSRHQRLFSTTPLPQRGQSARAFFSCIWHDTCMVKEGYSWNTEKSQTMGYHVRGDNFCSRFGTVYCTHTRRPWHSVAHVATPLGTRTRIHLPRETWKHTRP